VGVPLGVVAGDTDPHCAAEHETLQLTPLLAESLATVAVNCIVPLACTVAVVDDRLIVTAFVPPPQPETKVTKSRESGRSFFMGWTPFGDAH
jgi:hypothetical protein